MRGEVPRAVRHRQHLLPAQVSGQRRSTVAQQVPVVDGHRHAPLDLRDGVRPGGVPRLADLDAAIGRPPPVGPARAGTVAQALLARSVDQHEATVLDDVEGDAVEPLVGDQKPCHRRDLGQPPDRYVSLGELDTGEPPPGRHLTESEQQLSPARPDIDEVERVGEAEGRVHALGESPYRRGEERDRDVRAEVVRRGRPEEEAVGAVQGLLPGLLPGAGRHGASMPPVGPRPTERRSVMR